MTCKTIWLANHLHPPGAVDGHTMRERDGNPVGLPHMTSYSGNPGKILTTTDVKYGVNSLAVAKENSRKLQAIIDALPDSGGWIGISNDISLYEIALPTRTIRGISGQPINFRLYGTRPGIQVLGLSENPLFKLVGGESGVVHTPTRTALCELVDLSITSRGTGVFVKWAGIYFSANNCEVRVDAKLDPKGKPLPSPPGWHFDDCHSLHLGRVGAQGGYMSTGFLFENCIHVTASHLWSRGNNVGVRSHGVKHRNANFFGNWDVEGNAGYQCEFINTQKSRLNLYMESHERIFMDACNEMDFAGDGFRIDYVDELSKLLNPRIWEVQLNRVPDLGTPYGSYNPLPVTVTGPNAFQYATSQEMAEIGHWVDIAPGLPAYKTGGKVMDVRWRAKGKSPGEFIGRVLWNSDGNTWQNVPLRPSSDWQEYAFERGVASQDNARLFFIGEADSVVEFELLHIAQVGPRKDYCV